VLALGVPVSLSIKFVFERFDRIKNLSRILIYILSTLLLIAYYFLLLPDFNLVPMTRYIALSIAFYFAALLIPYFYERTNFELYVIKLILRFFTTLIFSIVLQLGISAILLTIDSLLGIQVYSNLYLYIWFIICGIFAPTFFLAGVPPNNLELEVEDYPKILKILLLYIVIPLISVYTLILYLYFAKVLITYKWPVGLVGHLVLWYSVISIFVIFLVYPLIAESKWVKNFIFWFPKLILPLIIMMFVSVGIRVSAYGITENRYFVLALGLWALGIMLYWSIARKNRNIVLPLSLAVIVFLSVIGPWSAYSTSIFSQNNRFKGILSKYNMIKDNTIIKPSSTIKAEDEKEINAILKYFNNSHSLMNVKYLPKDFKLTEVKNLFGFEYKDDYYGPQDNVYFSYSLNFVSSPHNISGFDYLFNFRYPGNTQNQSNQKIKAEFNRESQEFMMNYNGIEIYKRSLSDFAEELYEKYGTTSDKTITSEEMTFVDENKDVKIKFLFINIYGNRNTAENKTTIENMEFDVLVDIKVENTI
ncbi:MAG: hypothetical protein K0R09_2056, partial [Clostridiales bacterium]|nr:hypothetical protein [Clostridiales bacterium]